MPTTTDPGGSTILGREPKYRVIAELGRGGMASVYLALAKGLAGFSKLVVLKCIRPELALNTDFVTMFTDEARLAACLSHPNIVQTNEIVERGGAPVIVMEYLEGRTLSEVLRRAQRLSKPLPIALHIHILLEVLRGLHYAHEAADLNGAPLNLVHRDVTPQNIMVTYGGQVKILDFGIAKSAEASQETHAGVLKGKLRYMAPEQLVAAPVDRRADLFAVGVLLWQALAGRELWRDCADVDVMQAVVNGQFPSPRTYNETVPAEADEILARSLTFHAKDRFPTAREFEEALTGLAHEFGPRVAARDLELYMNGLFAADREEAKALVARTIGSAQESSFTGTGEIAFPSQIAPALIHPTIASHQEVFVETPRPRTAQRFTRWGTAVALLAIGGLAVVAVRKHDMRTPPPPQPNPATPAAPHATARIKIVVTPAEAKLSLDGTPLSGNPYEAVLPTDGRQHLVYAELAGYVSRQETFVLDGDVMASMALEREPVVPAVSSTKRIVPTPPIARAPSPPRRPQSVVSTPVTPTTNQDPPPTDSNRDCDPPYFMDRDGIRRIRPGCS